MKSRKKMTVVSIMVCVSLTAMVAGFTTPAGLLFQRLTGSGASNVVLADPPPNGDFYDLTVEHEFSVATTVGDSNAWFGTNEYPIQNVATYASGTVNVSAAGGCVHSYGEDEHCGSFTYYAAPEYSTSNYMAEFASDAWLGVLGDTGAMSVGDVAGPTGLNGWLELTGAYLAATSTQGQAVTAALHLSSTVVGGEGEGEGETCGEAFLGTMQGENPGSSLQIDAQGNVIIQLAGSSQQEMAQSATALLTPGSAASNFDPNRQTASQKARKHNLGGSFPKKGSVAAR